jgi:hypothetical protein
MSRSRKKQPYRAPRSFDTSCRCHGGCPWCYRNRMYQDWKERAAADAQVRDFARGADPRQWEDDRIDAAMEAYVAERNERAFAEWKR